MIAKKAAASIVGRSSMTPKAKARPSRKPADMTKTTTPARTAQNDIMSGKAVAGPEAPEDFSDVMAVLDRVGVKNDELAARINSLVTRLQ